MGLHQGQARAGESGVPPSHSGGAGTVAELLRARHDDDRPGLHHESSTWTWRQVVTESARRAALASELRRSGPFHIGVLLDNVPEYLFWLGAAALAGAAVVGINPTRRGPELARDIRFTDCQILVTDDGGARLLEGLALDVADDRVLRVEGEEYLARLGAAGSSSGSGAAGSEVSPEDLLLLLFTSGTTGDPKAVRCTQGRLAAIAGRAAEGYGFERDDVCYCPMPLFHGNAVMALWAPALATGASVALAGRFSASRFLADVRHFGATRFTYVGKALAYILATPERDDDNDNPLRQGFGTEASAPDRSIFERRFGCRLVEGYGSSEGGTAINVTPDTPPGSLGIPMPGDDVAVIDPATKQECERARFDAGGRLCNPGDAIGEIVSRTGARSFEGYYKNPEGDAERVRDRWYWSGDLGYRDEDGYFYFAGRGGDWLRVDSENFAAAPVERVIERHPDVSAAAVYAVPDPRTGDQVMTALELRPGARFDPDAFAVFLGSQADLGTKWPPRFVRLSPGLPLTATGKVTKASLRVEGWQCPDPVFWSPDRGELRYRPLTDDDRRALHAQFAEHGRSRLLGVGGPPRSRLVVPDVL
ncbi:MAG: AMP-binding protein [Acidimicrobiales bacterium]|nr:AMP-binding protein [Acidimicrobiales bacterium]